MNKRISEIRNNENLSQEKFADKLGLSRNFIAQLETGKKNPSDRTINDICRIFNINKDWLRYGTGEMKMPVTDKLSTYLGQIARSDDDLIEDIIEVYMDLNSTSKDVLKEVINKLADKRKAREI